MKLIASLLAAYAVFAAAPAAAQAQDFPRGQPIRIIVPIAAGGVTDAMARTLAEELKKSLGAPVLVDNRPGGNFGIGMGAAATAKPDGLTLGWIYANAVTTSPILYKNLPYKVSDFDYLSTVAASHFVLAVPKNSPLNSFQDYVAAVKKQNSPALIGVSSVAGGPHLMMEDIGGGVGIQFQPVVYRGEPPAVLDLLSGQVPTFVGVMASVAEQYKAGQVKILGISADKRIADFPEIPTFKEQGFPSAVVTFWHALAVPAGTPQPIKEKLHGAIVAAVNSPAFVARVRASADTSAVTSTPEQLVNRIKTETATNGQLITSRKITVQP